MILSLFLTAVAGARAEIVTREIDYKEGDTVLQGYLAYDSAKTGNRPAVMIVHDWDGITDYERMRARMLAELGYVAFCADIYGKGVRPTTPQENGAQASKYRSDRDLFRRRLQAGLDQTRKSPNVDTSKVAAIGYCFGGGGVLELARSGAELNGVVSFHGSLDTPNPADASNIKTKVMLFHASDDPAVPRAALSGFLDEMKAAGKDYQLTIYNLAVHAFTAPGQQYNADADRRSWQGMKTFFAEIFGGS